MNMVAVGGSAGLFLVGGVLAIMASMSASGSLTRNGAVGVRTKHTLISDAAWQSGHRAGASTMRVLAIVVLALAALLLLSGVVWSGEEPNAVTTVLFAAGYGAVLVGMIPLVRRVNRAARAAHDAEQVHPPDGGR